MQQTNGGADRCTDRRQVSCWAGALLLANKLTK